MHVQSDRRQPVVVIAPAHPAPDGSGNLVFEVRQRQGGTWALPVFSSVRQLTAELGTAQPWAALPLLSVMRIMSQAGVAHVVLDPVAEPGTRRWRESELRDLAGRLS